MNLVDQLLADGLNWFMSVWWYWLPAGAGYLYRVESLKYKIWDSEMRRKKVIKEIGIIFLLTILWNALHSTGISENAAIMTLLLTLALGIYGVVKDAEESGGALESILPILKNILVVLLSFQTLIGTVLGIILTCTLASLVYYFQIISIEKKTDLFEIYFLCAEALVISIYGEINNIQGLGILFFVIYQETALYGLNSFARYIISVACGE